MVIDDFAVSEGFGWSVSVVIIIVMIIVME